MLYRQRGNPIDLFAIGGARIHPRVIAGAHHHVCVKWPRIGNNPAIPTYRQELGEIAFGGTSQGPSA
jgi:hypothetical protein